MYGHGQKFKAYELLGHVAHLTTQDISNPVPGLKFEML
jgi:hypothetical protein